MTPNFGGRMPIAPKRLGATDYKFGMQLQVFMDNTDMTPNIFASKGAWPGSCYPNFPIPPLFEAPTRGNPLECRDEIWHHDASFLRFDTIPACDRQTDRRTDTLR